MKKIIIILLLIILPTFAYEVFMPDTYKYKNQGDKLLFVVDFSNSMTSYLNHQTKVNQVKEMMSDILPKISSDTQVGLRVYPKGMTPITYSLKQAVKKDFNGHDGIKHIILLTDGGENCDESPCDYSIELMKQRRDIKIDVIAFDVHDGDDLAQLKCTADVTGGSFREAETKAELLNSMEDMMMNWQ